MQETCSLCGEFEVSGAGGLCAHCWAYENGVVGWRDYVDTFYRVQNPVATRNVLLKVRLDRSRKAGELLKVWRWGPLREVIEEIEEIEAQLQIVAKG